MATRKSTPGKPNSVVGEKTIHRLRINLQDIEPPIWREVEVHSTVTLAKLNFILQGAMGWTNSHLYAFEIDSEHYGEKDDEFDGEDARKFSLKSVAPNPGDGFLFRYDFGDDWAHDVVVLAVGPAEPGAKYPRCTAGARACPPEDCGGAWGYRELLDILRDPQHEEYVEKTEWLGGADFDAEAFSVQRGNQGIKTLGQLGALESAAR